MQKSIYFRRVLALLLLALLLWAILTALLYSFISRPIFTRIKVDELQPKAEVIAGMASKNFLENDPYFDTLLNSSFDFFDAWIFVVDGLSGVILNNSLPASSAEIEPEIRSQINENMPSLMSGKYSSLWFSSRLKQSAGSGEMLFIGVPVQLLFGSKTNTVGAVFFVRPLEELNAGLRSMNTALMVSSLLVFLLMIVPAYFATARLIRPLRQTCDVAQAMAAGDFGVRADARQKGEIGELAATMNNLAAKLEANLSALTMERNRLSQILEGMSEGLIAVDRSLGITKANPAVGCLLGSASPGEPIHDFSQLPDRADLIQAFKKAIMENDEVTLTLLHNGCNILGQIAPLCDESGQVAGAVGLFRDVTESVHLEQTRRDYVANVSHELRTPLTAMRALIEPLRDGLVTSDSDRHRYYGIMLRETIRLSRLINDMLELSRLQAGSLSIAVEPFDLQPLMDELEQKMAVQAEDSDLILHFPDNLGQCPRVIGNQDRVEQVLVILIDNAMKYTPAGGKIDLHLSWNDRQVFIAVQDTGIGIAAEDVSKVFDRFYKADKAHQQPGTGLGLAIAREILLQMGQAIQVKSELGHGSVFSFTLDRAVNQSTRPDMELL